ncbi:Beta-caryophyllene synthase [Dichanthelium oligosanthes]|uniref:Beta-caryophyllene synthase n=1 Tax=Dichanthelium oligosanthes TaxID=888268 RepID=A0A1E5WC51_9POAL|nr:Beta-caryophyllene synthase [Dichanthelium oligosanthes]
MAALREAESSNDTGCRVIAQGYKVLDEKRHAVDYRPSVWGDYFIKSPTLPHTYEVYMYINQISKIWTTCIPMINDKEDCDELVLELAKLDFYLLQRIHREEVKEICEWYHGLESPQKLFYARHRPTEAYFWALGVYYEQKYANARKLLAKFIATITPYDDTFDNYGIWEELQPFADVMQRWDMREVEKLNGCYSDFARFMFGTMIEIENALPKDIGRRNVNFIRDIINEVCKGYVTEICWRDSEYIPSLEEHLKVTLITCFYWAINCTAFVVFEENVTEELLKWMSKFPQIVKDSCIISRLMDDIVAHEFETERNNVATAVTCYMKECEATKEEASKVLWDSVENAWKSMNHEYLTWTSIPPTLLIRVINLARMMETMYKDIDGYTDSKILKEWISILLDKPIPF